MSEYTFEMVPGLVGRIAELLASIDQKLDKVNEDTGAPILYTSLRGEQYGKYVIAFSSEPVEYFEK